MHKRTRANEVLLLLKYEACGSLKVPSKVLLMEWEGHVWKHQSSSEHEGV